MSPDSAGGATAELVTSYYVPWPEEETRSAEDENLSLRVAFDTQEAEVGERVTCTVFASRVAFRGYGMMLAEIGLPPGAELDVASIERSIEKHGWYEKQPDRVVFYLWSRPGGTELSFEFSPRFSGEIVSVPSVLYDYYNPEAEVVVPPARFRFLTPPVAVN
jgi:hypothetical protein